MLKKIVGKLREFMVWFCEPVIVRYKSVFQNNLLA